MAFLFLFLFLGVYNLPLSEILNGPDLVVNKITLHNFALHDGAWPSPSPTASILSSCCLGMPFPGSKNSRGSSLVHILYPTKMSQILKRNKEAEVIVFSYIQNLHLEGKRHYRTKT